MLPFGGRVNPRYPAACAIAPASLRRPAMNWRKCRPCRRVAVARGDRCCRSRLRCSRRYCWSDAPSVSVPTIPMRAVGAMQPPGSMKVRTSKTSESRWTFRLPRASRTRRPFRPMSGAMHRLLRVAMACATRARRAPHACAIAVRARRAAAMACAMVARRARRAWSIAVRAPRAAVTERATRRKPVQRVSQIAARVHRAAAITCAMVARPVRPARVIAVCARRAVATEPATVARRARAARVTAVRARRAVVTEPATAVRPARVARAIAVRAHHHAARCEPGERWRVVIRSRRATGVSCW